MKRSGHSIDKAGGAWLAALVFSLVYLLCDFSGFSPWTTISRAGISAAVAYFVGRYLMKILADVILDAIAEHRRKVEEEERRKRDEEEAMA